MIPPNASTTNQSGRTTGVSGRGGGNSDSDSTGTEGRRARGGCARGRGGGRDNSTGRSTSSGSTGSGKRERSQSSEDIRGDGAPADNLNNRTASQINCRIRIQTDRDREGRRLVGKIRIDLGWCHVQLTTRCQVVTGSNDTKRGIGVRGDIDGIRLGQINATCPLVTVVNLLGSRVHSRLSEVNHHTHQRERSISLAGSAAFTPACRLHGGY